METSTIIWLVILGVVLIALYSLIKGWVVIFNKFQYWINRAKRKFADIEIIMQQRIDMIYALAQVIKKYDIHEYKTFKDVTEARSRWTKDTDLNEKVKLAQEIENNFIKIQAVFEKYPKLRASELHKRLMGHGNLSRIEFKLRNARLSYNHVVQQYNERINVFPRNIVAWAHGFKEFNYLNFSNQEPYKPKEIFNE